MNSYYFQEIATVHAMRSIVAIFLYRLVVSVFICLLCNYQLLNACTQPETAEADGGRYQKIDKE